MLIKDALLRPELHIGDVFVGAKIDPIEQARIVALPPFSFSVGEGLVGIIRYACLGSGGVAAKGRLVPPPGVLVMKRYTVTHAGRVGGF